MTPDDVAREIARCAPARSPGVTPRKGVVGYIDGLKFRCADDKPEDPAERDKVFAGQDERLTCHICGKQVDVEMER